MPFNIIRNDITKVKADAIVNTANPNPVIGSGTDAAIYRRAGADKLLEERKKIGPIQPGKVEYTDAFNLDAKYIFHAVGTFWVDGKHGEIDILRSCYSSSLKLAEKLKCKSIAFPLMATGAYGFPREEALEIAIDEITTFLLNNLALKIYLVVFDERSWLLLQEKFGSIQTYIDKYYVKRKIDSEYSQTSGVRRRKTYIEIEKGYGDSVELSELKSCTSLEVITSLTCQTFQQKLFEYIDRSGLKEPEFYRKAYITRQLFSQIRSNVNYKPKKKTVILCGLALELEIEEFTGLLEKAGYALTGTNLSDAIVYYYVTHHIFDIMLINETLSTYDLPILY